VEEDADFLLVCTLFSSLGWSPSPMSTRSTLPRDEVDDWQVMEWWGGGGGREAEEWVVKGGEVDGEGKEGWTRSIGRARMARLSLEFLSL
jgi:hypothetical protein